MLSKKELQKKKENSLTEEQKKYNENQKFYSVCVYMIGEYEAITEHYNLDRKCFTIINNPSDNKLYSLIVSAKIVDRNNNELRTEETIVPLDFSKMTIEICGNFLTEDDSHIGIPKEEKIIEMEKINAKKE